MKLTIELHRAAARALARVGIDALTLDHIAEEAGVSRDELDKLYSTVTDALREMVIAGFDELHEIVKIDVRGRRMAPRR
jgi:AcrR family transcriptional regulator